MARLKFLVDSNVVIDYLSCRKPFFEQARLLMTCGRVGEFDLWITASQATDILYVISNGARKSELPTARQRMRAFCQFVHVIDVQSQDVLAMLSSDWADAEDALIYEVAARIHADAIVTRNQTDFEAKGVRVLNCEELFAWVRQEQGVDYSEMDV